MRSPNKRPDPTDNPLTNPYAAFPEEEKTEEKIDAEALSLAHDLVENWLSKKDRSTKAEIEFMEALCSDEFIAAFDNVLKVSKSNDCTKLSAKYFDSMQLLVKAFEARLTKQFRFYVENN